MSERKSAGKEDEKMDIEVDSSNESLSSDYLLSAQLSGHDHVVRDIAICDSTLLATCEERGKMHIWAARTANAVNASISLAATPSAPPRLTWSEQPVFSSNLHLSLTFVLECIRDRSSPTSPSPYPPASFMSGGADKAARPFTANGSILEPLEPHGNSVNSISVLPDGHTVTGAWDGIVRVWDGAKSKQLYQVVGHEHAVEVLAVGDVIISGSANKAIHIIQGGKVIKRIPHAHDHAIKKLIKHPMGFASAGNDGFIKVWSLDGEQLQAIPAHVSSEVQFVYGLALIPQTDELVSCGDDGQVKLWRGDQCVQVIRHPGSVRAVKAFANGDIITACADRTARIWTRSPARYAGQSERDEYEQVIQHIMVANMTPVEASTLPDESALTEPGKKDQQVLVINKKGAGPWAYQWNEEAHAWIEVGSVMGKSNKQTIDGVDYDSVTNIFISDTHSVKLGVNRDDDPYEVADRFCALYDLPPDAKNQIVQHVRPLTDPVAAAERKRREAEALESSSLKQVPGWKHGGLEVYASINVKGMKDKILQGNQQLHTLSPSELQLIDRLIDELADTKTLHVHQWPAPLTKLIIKLLAWPTDWSPAVLDCVRVAMISGGGVDALNIDTVHQSVIEQASKGKEVHMQLFHKIYSNFIAKRKKGKGEKPPSPVIEPAVLALIGRVVEVGRPAAGASGKVVDSYMLLCHNVVSWIGRLGAEGKDVEQLLMAVVDGVLHTMQVEGRSVKGDFYGLLSIGSIGFAVKKMRAAVMAQHGHELSELLKRGKSNDNQAMREVAADVERLFITQP